MPVWQDNWKKVSVGEIPPDAVRGRNVLHCTPECANLWAFLIRQHYDRLSRLSQHFPKLKVKNQPLDLKKKMVWETPAG